jgi:hypothetical protein
MTTAGKDPKPGKVDMKLEVSVIPVSDVDRAKNFYENLGWRLDADFIRVDGSPPCNSRPPARQPRSSSAPGRHCRTSSS